MKDRVPGAAGQFKAVISPDQLAALQEGKEFTIKLTRDDHPVVEGTPYNKASVLPDALAEQICPGIEDPTLADALAALLPKLGGTLSGALNMNENKITGLPAPDDDKDAATKEYADSKIPKYLSCVEDMDKMDQPFGHVIGSETKNHYLPDEIGLAINAIVIPLPFCRKCQYILYYSGVIACREMTKTGDDASVFVWGEWRRVNDNVSFSQELTSGTEVGTLTINGKSTPIYTSLIRVFMRDADDGIGFEQRGEQQNQFCKTGTLVPKLYVVTVKDNQCVLDSGEVIHYTITIDWRTPSGVYALGKNKNNTVNLLRYYKGTTEAGDGFELLSHDCELVHIAGYA